MSSTILPLCCNYPLGYGDIAGEVNAWDESLLQVSVLAIAACDFPKLPQRVQAHEPIGAMQLTLWYKNAWCCHVQYNTSLVAAPPTLIRRTIHPQVDQQQQSNDSFATGNHPCFLLIAR